MSGHVQHRYQDVVIVNIGKSSSQTSKKNNRYLLFHILAGVLTALLMITIGYLACVHAGLIAPPDAQCCFGVLELDFDFDFSGANTEP